jgi:hypothetical protein
MRPLLSAFFAAAITGVGLVPSPASAAGDSLAETRTRLAALYAKAAASSQQYDDAMAALAEADRAVEREKRAVHQARADMAEQSSAVAALTVQQLQFQTGRTPLLSLIAREDPRDVLALSSAYDSAAEAMAARIDELSARQTVHSAIQRRLERTRASQRRAAAQAAEARSTINAAIAESKRATLAAAAASSSPAQAPPPVDQAPSMSAPSQPETASPQAPSPPPSPPDVPQGDVQPGDDAVWDRIAMCESGGNWHINTGNGYYGGLQFSERTWLGIGGSGLPHEHSREVQIHYAKLLQAKYGWGQWSCAWARFA